MKICFILATWFALLTGSTTLGQQTQERAVQNVIDNFFVGFHEQNASILRENVLENIIMQSVSKNKDGHVSITSIPFEKFIERITGNPKETVLREKIISYNIQIDGDMANVWTPYEFWINNEFHHCGVNSFQLVKLNEQWKIIYIIDTRRTTDCLD